MAAGLEAGRTGGEGQIAVVTGASRGLGREVARALAAQGYHVVGTVRSDATGEAFRGWLAQRGFGSTFLTLDVTAPDAGARLAAAVPDGVDVVVNNAAVALQGFDLAVVDNTLAVNVTGALRVLDALVPRLRPGARVVNVASGIADEATLDPALRARFSAPDLDRARLAALLAEFRAADARDCADPSPWPRSAYRTSKLALNAATRMLARDLAADPRAPRVNSVCPGWVRTDMGGAEAPRSLDEGAASILWATAIGPDGPTGGFFRDGKPAPW